MKKVMIVFMIISLVLLGIPVSYADQSDELYSLVTILTKALRAQPRLQLDNFMHFDIENLDYSVDNSIQKQLFVPINKESNIILTLSGVLIDRFWFSDLYIQQDDGPRYHWLNISQE